MDATLAGLLHDCAGDPDDLGPRLILADWLEDRGQPERAAFVRLQCRLAARVPDYQERRQLIDEQNAMLVKHVARWLGPLRDLCEHVEFVNGLCRIRVRGRQANSRAFWKAFTASCEQALVEQLRVTRCKKIGRIVAAPEIGLVPGLSFAALGIGDDALDEILASPGLDHLASLDLSNNRITDAGAQSLCQSSLLGRLVRLEVRNTAITASMICKLLDATGEGNLRDLDPMGTPLDARTLAELAAWRARPGKDSRRVMNSLGMEFVHIPAGSFLMGSTDAEMATVDRDNEGPQHPVTLTRPYYFGRFAVTQATYLAVTGENPARFSDNLARPVELVNYHEAREFCRLLSALPEELAAGRSYRLPTEAEWEYACRAGTFTPFHQGDPPTTDFVNYDGNYVYADMPKGAYLHRPQPVGTYPPNAFGLYEMHGNIWEWTSDRYLSFYEEGPAVDPNGPPEEEGSTRAIRGGCWDAVCSYCRSAHRFGEEQGDRDDYTGFRVVLMLAPETRRTG